MTPHTQQAKIEHKNRTKERGHTQDMGQVNNGIGPDAGFAHGMTECGILEPRHELRHHAVSIGLLTVGINVVCAAFPNHTLGLDLKFLGIKVPMALNGDLSSNRNNSFLEAGSLSAWWRRQSDVPDLAIRTYLHRSVRTGKTDAAFNSSGK